MEGFKQALNEWIQVASWEWISQALLKQLLKNDEFKKTNNIIEAFDSEDNLLIDINKLNQDSQKALLFLTEEIGNRLPTNLQSGKLRTVKNYNILGQDYNLVDDIETTDVLSISEEEIDNVLAEFENKMRGVEVTEAQAESVVAKTEEVKEEYIPNLDNVDMDNLPTGENLRELMEAVFKAAGTSEKEIMESDQILILNKPKGKKYIRTVEDETKGISIVPDTLRAANVNNTRNDGRAIFIAYLLDTWFMSLNN